MVEKLGEREIRLHPLVRVCGATDRGQVEFAAECAANVGEALWDLGRLNDEVEARGVDAVLGDLRIGARRTGV